MEPPPLPAVLVFSGLGVNAARAVRSRLRPDLPPKRTFSRWVAPYKKVAVPIAIGFGTWCAVHWALYVIEEIST